MIDPEKTIDMRFLVNEDGDIRDGKLFIVEKDIFIKSTERKIKFSVDRIRDVSFSSPPSVEKISNKPLTILLSDDHLLTLDLERRKRIGLFGLIFQKILNKNTVHIENNNSPAKQTNIKIDDKNIILVDENGKKASLLPEKVVSINNGVYKKNPTKKKLKINYSIVNAGIHNSMKLILTFSNKRLLHLFARYIKLTQKEFEYRISSQKYTPSKVNVLEEIYTSKKPSVKGIIKECSDISVEEIQELQDSLLVQVKNENISLTRFGVFLLVNAKF